jgi:hypothetical protein
VQEATNSFLACLVEGCSRHSPEAVQGMLQFGMMLYWGVPAADLSPLQAAVWRRLAEAADLGHFAIPGSLLGSLAAQLTNVMLVTRCKSGSGWGTDLCSP